MPVVTNLDLYKHMPMEEPPTGSLTTTGENSGQIHLTFTIVCNRYQLVLNKMNVGYLQTRLVAILSIDIAEPRTQNPYKGCSKTQGALNTAIFSINTITSDISNIDILFDEFLSHISLNINFTAFQPLSSKTSSTARPLFNEISLSGDKPPINTPIFFFFQSSHNIILYVSECKCISLIVSFFY